MKRLIILLLLLGSIASAQQPCRIACWNVENLFDTHNDTLTADNEFTPTGERHWTSKKLNLKINNLYKTIVALGTTDSTAATPLNMPVAIGLVEVENDFVLQMLCNSTPLRRFNYRYIHYNSPDPRGIDCALLYLPSRFRPLYSKPLRTLPSDSTLHTRDLLVVSGVVDNRDTFFIVVNHWPSKLGGSENDRRRIAVARQLYNIIYSLTTLHPTTIAIAMGDFNSEPYEEPMTIGMGFTPQGNNAAGWTNLAALLPSGSGTYNYQHQWSLLDQIIIAGNYQLHPDTPFNAPQSQPLSTTQPIESKVVSSHKGSPPPQADTTFISPYSDTTTSAPQANTATPQPWQTYGMKVFAPSFLLQDDPRGYGTKPYRTYLGVRYLGGFSDHLPIYIDLIKP